MEPYPEKLEDLLVLYENRYRGSAFGWKIGFRSLLVTSALFSSSAAVVGKLTYWKADFSSDLAAILAGLSAVIATLIAALDFEANMRINQKSRHAVNILRLALRKSDANQDELLEKLADVIRERSGDLERHD